MKRNKSNSQLWQQIGLSFLCLVLAVTLAAMLFVTIFVEQALGEIIVDNGNQGTLGSTTIGTLRNAVLFGTSYFLLSVSMTLVNLIPLVVFLFIPNVFIYLAPLWLCIWFSFAAYCNTGLLKVPFSNVTVPDEETDSTSSD